MGRGRHVSPLSPMKLSAEQVKKIALLARLEFSEADLEKYSGQLSAILDYVEKLNGLDVASIEPTAHAVSVSTPFREDTVVSFNGQEEAFAQAPDRDGNFFRVPKVV